MNAKPILEDYSLPATFFLTSGYLQGGNDFWWDALEKPFFQKMRIPATLEIEIERALLTFDFAGDTEYRDLAFADHRHWRAWDPPLSKRHLVYHQLWQILHRLPSSTRERLLDTIQGWAGATPTAPDPLAALYHPQKCGNWPLERESRLVDTRSHTLPSPFSIAKARKTGNRGEQAPPRGAARAAVAPLLLPHGELSEDTVSLLKQAGYGAACTSRSAAVERSADLFRLPRICWMIGSGKNSRVG